MFIYFLSTSFNHSVIILGMKRVFGFRPRLLSETRVEVLIEQFGSCEKSS